jgi:hypothetical protein
MTNIYYVYAYLREDGTPYYIGKGKKQRYKTQHSVPIPTNLQNIVFLEKNLTEVGAFAIERRMIEWYGRVSKKNGILLNTQPGGQGGSYTLTKPRKKSNPKMRYCRYGWNWDLA